MAELGSEQLVARLRPGALLVATPELRGPTFGRTVILLVAYGPAGTLGVVLNRPTETPVHNVLPAWAAAASKAAVVFAGGPVRTDAAMCVGVSTGRQPDLVPRLAVIAGRLCLVDLEADPTELRPALRGIRLFGGHAGWAPEQLEDEVRAGSWFVVSGRPDDVLAPPKVDLWFEALRRQGFPLAWYAWHPGDLARN